MAPVDGYQTIHQKFTDLLFFKDYTMKNSPERIALDSTMNGPEFVVAIAGRHDSLSTYGDCLRLNTDAVTKYVQLIPANQTIENASRQVRELIEVLCCGRIIQFGANNIGERCFCCLRSKRCLCCLRDLARPRRPDRLTELPTKANSLPFPSNKKDIAVFRVNENQAVFVAAKWFRREQNFLTREAVRSVNELLPQHLQQEVESRPTVIKRITPKGT